MTIVDHPTSEASRPNAVERLPLGTRSLAGIPAGPDRDADDSRHPDADAGQEPTTGSGFNDNELAYEMLPDGAEYDYDFEGCREAVHAGDWQQYAERAHAAEAAEASSPMLLADARALLAEELPARTHAALQESGFGYVNFSVETGFAEVERRCEARVWWRSGVLKHYTGGDWESVVRDVLTGRDELAAAAVKGVA